MNTMALIQTCQIQAIMTVPLRLSFSARLTNCNVGPCLQVELCTLSLLHLSYNTHSSKGFSCSLKFTTEKHWCPVSTFSYFHGKAFLGKPATITFGEKKECVMDQIQTVVWQFFCASLGRSLCHGNKHHGIDPNMSNSGHHDCSRKPVFPLHCQTAILTHVGTLNSAYWALSTFQSAFISAILYLFYEILSWAGLGRILAVACATTENTDVHKGMLLWESFP